MKEDVEKEYGKGAFDKYFIMDIVRFLGSSEFERGINLMEKMDSDRDVVRHQKTKSYDDVLLDGTVNKSKLMKIEEGCVPLKPLAAPTIAGGNVVIEIDEDAYQRGIDGLKYSVIAKLMLPRGDKVLTTMEIRNKLSVY